MWMINYGPGINTRAEILGVWALLNLENRLHIHDLQVFEDSRIFIDWLNHKCALKVLNLFYWKDRIKELIKYFRDLEFTHIYREFNQVADELSKKPLQQQEGKITYYQMEDEVSLPFLRINSPSVFCCQFIYAYSVGLKRRK